MEYRSPLGSNFKLDESISASNGKTCLSPPDRELFSPVNCDSSSKNKPIKAWYSGGRGRNSCFDKTPQWQRNSQSGKSSTPLISQQESSPVPISQFYHPSMLENPWEELERNLK